MGREDTGRARLGYLCRGRGIASNATAVIVTVCVCVVAAVGLCHQSGADTRSDDISLRASRHRARQEEMTVAAVAPSRSADVTHSSVSVECLANCLGDDDASLLLYLLVLSSLRVELSADWN